MTMTNEEIDAEIAKLTALKEQNNQSQTTEINKPADGVYNPADYIGQITNKMNEAGYTDEQGNKKSYGRGDKFSGNLDVAKNAGKRGNRTEDQFGNPLPDTAYEYITQMLNSERAKGSVSKHTLRMIENEAKARYNLPSKFDISGLGLGNTDNKMAKAMNSMSYNGKAQEPAQTPQAPQAPKEPAKAEDKPKGKQVANSNKGVAGASVGDFIVRSDGSTHVLTQADIDWAKKKTTRQTQQVDENTVRGTTDQMKADGANGNGLNDDDVQFMNQYKQYTQQLSGAQPRDPAGVKALQESKPHKFVTDPANVERYKKLSQVQKDTKKVERRDTPGTGQAVPGNMR